VGIGFGFSEANWFWVSQLVLRRGDECNQQISHERLPRGAALVGTLSDGAEQREQGVSGAAQAGDNESRARTGFNPRVIVFLESGVEDLVRLDAPVSTSNQWSALRRTLGMLEIRYRSSTRGSAVSGHEPCPKPKPNPKTDALRGTPRIEPVPTGGPAWLQQRKKTDRVGHPVERYG
jgi:hypothetical protein